MRHSPHPPTLQKPPIHGQASPSHPRWSQIKTPRVRNMAQFEWDIVEGLTWYSEEWESMIMDEYDYTIRNNQEWWMERVPPEDMNKLYRGCLSVHAGFVTVSQCLYRIRRGDGVWRTFCTHCSITERTPDGAPFIASGVVVDVTDMVSIKGEFHLGNSLTEIDFQSMLENSPDLFIRFDRDMRPVYCNPPVNRFLGGFNNQPGKEQRLAGDYKNEFKKNVELVFAGQKFAREELSLRMSDGSIVLGACTFWPEYDSEGKLQYVMVQFKDITEQRRMEEQLRLSERSTTALYDLTMMENESESTVLSFVMESLLHLLDSKSGFFFLPSQEDPEKGRLLWSDDHFEYLDPALLPEDYLPEDLKIQIVDSQGRLRPRSINNGDGVTPLYIVFDGKMRVMRGITSMVVEDGRPVFVAGVCNRDRAYTEADLKQFETFINSAWLILRRRRSIQELEKAKEAAVEANTAKNAFLANVSHELRTPLNGMLSMLEFIEALPLGDEQREYLKTARASGKSLLRIISDLLDYSSMEAGKMRLAMEIFHCAAAVRSALSMFAEEASRKGLMFTYHIAPELPKRLFGDEARLRQVIYNLVGNAMKFTPAGGSIRVRCCPGKNAPQGRVALELTVSDTGIGIPKDKLSSIFDAFMQVETTHRRRYKGTGLGLSIVKHLVSMMEGSITIESDLGKGTVVSCTLMFDLPSHNQTVASDAQDIAVLAPPRTLRILLAEDDRVSSMALRTFLQKRGHHVVCVDDGKQALEALSVFPFDCLFTDITMPEMDGLELVGLIRAGKYAEEASPAVRERITSVFPDAGDEKSALSKDLPVIAVSAHSMIGDREHFLDQGMSYYISKPINKDELDGALQYVYRHTL